MKYYKIYPIADKEKIPQFIKKMLTPDYYYSNITDRRKKLIKYPDGSFNYIPIKCDNGVNCKNEKCPYSHTDNEMEYHPLYYKTRLYSLSGKGCFARNACDLLNDFRIIYNYRDTNIMNLMKLLDEKK